MFTCNRTLLRPAKSGSHVRYVVWFGGGYSGSPAGPAKTEITQLRVWPCASLHHGSRTAKVPSWRSRTFDGSAVLPPHHQIRQLLAALLLQLDRLDIYSAACWQRMRDSLPAAVSLLLLLLRVGAPVSQCHRVVQVQPQRPLCRLLRCEHARRQTAVESQREQQERGDGASRETGADVEAAAPPIAAHAGTMLPTRLREWQLRTGAVMWPGPR